METMTTLMFLTMPGGLEWVITLLAGMVCVGVPVAVLLIVVMMSKRNGQDQVDEVIEEPRAHKDESTQEDS